MENKEAIKMFGIGWIIQALVFIIIAFLPKTINILIFGSVIIFQLFGIALIVVGLANFFENICVRREEKSNGI